MAIRESRSQKSSLDPAWRMLTVSDQERERRRKSLDMSILVLIKKKKEKTRKKSKRNEAFHRDFRNFKPPFSLFPTFFPWYATVKILLFTSVRFYALFMVPSGGNCIAKNRLALTRERYPDVHIIDELLGESPVLLISQGGLKRCLGFSLYVYHSRNRK